MDKRPNVTDSSREYRRSALSRNTNVHVPLAVVGAAMVAMMWWFLGRIEAAEAMARGADFQSNRACDKADMQTAHIGTELADINSRLKNIEVLLMQRNDP